MKKTHIESEENPCWLQNVHLHTYHSCKKNDNISKQCFLRSALFCCCSTTYTQQKPFNASSHCFHIFVVAVAALLIFPRRWLFPSSLYIVFPPNSQKFIEINNPKRTKNAYLPNNIPELSLFSVVCCVVCVECVCVCVCILYRNFISSFPFSIGRFFVGAM